MTKEKTISIYEEAGQFAENKDTARNLRLNKILPALNSGETVILDFRRVSSTTQSFIHALISDVIRIKGVDVLDKMLFKNCNEVVKAVIEIVVDYMQEPPAHISNGRIGPKK